MVPTKAIKRTTQEIILNNVTMSTLNKKIYAQWVRDEEYRQAQWRNTDRRNEGIQTGAVKKNRQVIYS